MSIPNSQFIPLPSIPFPFGNCKFVFLSLWVCFCFVNKFSCHVTFKSSPCEELQDGGRVRCRDHLPLHKYIRNTSTCGTTPTEHLLNAGRRPQTPQKARNSPCTWVGEKQKEKTETKNRDGTCTSGRELWRRKGVHTLGSPFVGGDSRWWRGEASEPRRRTQQQGCRGQRGEIPAHRIGADQHSPAQEACLLTCWDRWGLAAEAQALEVRSQGEDWGWLLEHSLKGLVRHS